jgi:hypothetical protein
MIHGGRLHGVIADERVIYAGVVDGFENLGNEQRRQDGDHRKHSNHFYQGEGLGLRLLRLLQRE